MAIDAPIHSNEANFERVLNAGLPVMVVLWRRDCAPCEQLNAALERLAKTYAGKALVVKVNVDDEAGLARRLAAAQLPQIVFFKGAREVGRGAGAAPESELNRWLEHLVNGGATPSAPTGPSVPFGAAAPAGARGQRAGGYGGAPSHGAPPHGGPPHGAGSAPSGASGGARPQGTGGGAYAGAKAEPMVLTDANFDTVVGTSSVPVLVDFWAVWCGPCKMIAPHVAALAQEFAGRAVVGKMNVDENPRVAGRYGIMSIPTLLIFKDGKVVDQIVGAQPAQVLRQRLSRHV